MAPGSRGRRPGRRRRRDSRPGCGPHRPPTPARRGRPRPPGCRRDDRRGPRRPSPCCCGSGSRASRTAGPPPGRPAPGQARRVGPARSSTGQTVGPEVVDVEYVTAARRSRPPVVTVLYRPCRLRLRAVPGQRPAPGQRARARSISAGDQQRGGEPEHVGPGGVDDQPGLERRRQAVAAHVLQDGGQQQALAPHRRHAGSVSSPARNRSRPPGPGRHVLGLHDRQGGPGGRHGQGLATEGAPVVARHEGGGHLGPGPARPDRHAVAQGLGHGHHVGLEPSAGSRTTRPVRPRPVWTSSTMSRMSRSVHSWRRPPDSRRRGRSPRPPPWIGSSRTAATRGGRRPHPWRRGRRRERGRTLGQGQERLCLRAGRWRPAWPGSARGRRPRR